MGNIISWLVKQCLLFALHHITRSTEHWKWPGSPQTPPVSHFGQCAIYDPCTLHFMALDLSSLISEELIDTNSYCSQSIVTVIYSTNLLAFNNTYMIPICKIRLVDMYEDTSNTPLWWSDSFCGQVVSHYHVLPCRASLKLKKIRENLISRCLLNCIDFWYKSIIAYHRQSVQSYFEAFQSQISDL